MRYGEFLAHALGEPCDSPKQASRFLDKLREIQAHDDAALVLGGLRTYHLAPNPYRGLAEVYAWLCELDEVPCWPAADLEKAFRRGEHVEARRRAANAYADWVLKLDRWLGGTGFVSESDSKHVHRDDAGRFTSDATCAECCQDDGPVRVYVDGDRSPVDHYRWRLP